LNFSAMKWHTCMYMSHKKWYTIYSVIPLIVGP
jgi:hypothetical protein